MIILSIDAFYVCTYPASYISIIQYCHGELCLLVDAGFVHRWMYSARDTCTYAFSILFIQECMNLYEQIEHSF